MWQGHAAVLGDVAWPDTGREDKTDVWDKTYCYFQFLIPAHPRQTGGLGLPGIWALLLSKHLAASVIKLSVTVEMQFAFPSIFSPLSCSPLSFFFLLWYSLFPQCSRFPSRNITRMCRVLG